jgi:hypothetical protein
MFPPAAKQERAACDAPRVRGNVARIGGTGLGLAGVAAMVELHGGQVAMASKPGWGTTVVVRLPALAAVASPRSAPSASSALHALLLGVQHCGGPDRGPGHRAVCAQGDRRASRRDHQRGQRRGVGQHLHRHPPADATPRTGVGRGAAHGRSGPHLNPVCSPATRQRWARFDSCYTVPCGRNQGTG